MDDIWGDLELSDDEEVEAGGSDNDEGGDGDGDENYHGAAQHVLVLLDCGEGMWKKFLPNPQPDEDDDDDDDDDDKISPLDQALYVLQDLVRNQVRETSTGQSGSRRDAFGLVLYDTKHRHKRMVSKKDGITTAKSDDKKKDDKNKDKNNKNNDDDDEVDYGRDSKTIVHELIPLKQPGITTINTIRAALPDYFGDRQVDLEKEYAPTSKKDDDEDDDDDDDEDDISRLQPLGEALQQAQLVYKEAKCVKDKQSKDMMAPDRKQIWIFTNNDQPRNASGVPKQVKDLDESGFEVFVWPFPKAPSSQPSFSYNLFYDKVQKAVMPLREQQQQQGEMVEKNDDPKKQQQQMRDLVQQMMGKWKKTRPCFKGLPLTFPSLCTDNNSDNNAPPTPTQIPMDWYYMVQVHKPPQELVVHQETGRTLQTVRQVVTKDASNEILVETVKGPGAAAYLKQQELEGHDYASKWRAGKRRLFPHVVIGGDKVPMSPQDRNDIRMTCNRHAEQRHCSLIGFRKMPPSGRIPLTWSMGKSYLCLPAEEAAASTTTTTTPAASASATATATGTDDNNDDTSKNKKDDDNDNAALMAFAHLHASMLRKKVYAMCELLTSVKSSQSRLAALWPLERQASPPKDDDDEEEEADDDDLDRHPAGFLVIRLPFVDELKQVPLDKADAPMVVASNGEQETAVLAGVKMEEMDEPQPVVTSSSSSSAKVAAAGDKDDALFKAAVELVNKQRYSNSVELGVNFENAHLKQFWSHIEKVALGLAPNETSNGGGDDDIDDTKVDEEATLQNAGEQIKTFSEALPEDVKIESGTTSKKRKKVSLDEVGDLEVFFRSLYKENNLGERTANDLKRFLKLVGLKQSGKKQDLINRITEYFELEEDGTGEANVKVEDEVHVKMEEGDLQISSI